MATPRRDLGPAILGSDDLRPRRLCLCPAGVRLLHRRLGGRAVSVLRWWAAAGCGRTDHLHRLVTPPALRSLGLRLDNWPQAAALGLLFAGVQFFLTLYGYALPAPDLVPLVTSLTVGLFEAVFFRGFVQTRLEASFLPAVGVGGAAALFVVYRVGCGMGWWRWCSCSASVWSTPWATAAGPAEGSDAPRWSAGCSGRWCGCPRWWRPRVPVRRRTAPNTSRHRRLCRPRC